MNTIDVTLVKIIEQNNKYSKNCINAIELKVLYKNQDEKDMNCYDRVYLCYENTNFNPFNTYTFVKGFDCYR